MSRHKGGALFEASEYYHYAKRAEVYGLDQETNSLREAGWRFSHGEPFVAEDYEQALLRIAKIPKLAKTCSSQDCPKCKKLVKAFGKTASPTPWQLDLELYRWQKEAKELWMQQGGRGIIRVVTGAGKTILALALVEYLYGRYSHDDLKTIIVVPTTALLDQWLGNLLDYLNIPCKDIGTYYGENKDDIEEKQIMLYVINSARDKLPGHLAEVNQDIFLIADECHRAGSTMNRKIFQASYDYVLGLSATPERQGDYGFETVLVKNLGEVIYSYSYSDARKDSVIPPYRLKRIAVPLTSFEQSKYDEYTEKIRKVARILFSRYPELKSASNKQFFKRLGQLQRSKDDKYIKQYVGLVNARKGVVHKSETKISTLEYLIQNEIDTRARILIFHERTAYADRIDDIFRENGIKSAVYHTKIAPATRRKNLSDYKNGKINTLITCRALDEGLDVPDTSVGIIVAATSSVRQRVQRVGRILRKSPGKDYSEIYTIYITGIEDNIFSEYDLRILEKSAQKIEKVEMSISSTSR